MNWKRTVFPSLLFLVAIVFDGISELKAQPAERPNILFAIADDASFPHMGAYETDWIETPAFDRVAEEGLLFMKAYTPNPKCAPSRSIILTGRHSWQLEEAANHWPRFPEKFKVYTEVLAENGYRVGSTGKGWAPGVAETKQGEPRHLAGQPFNDIQTDPPTAQISTNDYAANFEQFLNQKEPDTPFAFWYGGYEPHRGYVYSSGIQVGGKEISQIQDMPDFWPASDSIRVDMLDYAMEIEHFDSHLSRMLDLLEERGELDNTLVVVTADNGMPFPRVKGQIYEYSAHMPLAIMWRSGIENPGRKVTEYVSFTDFAPTFIELAGLNWEQSGMEKHSGQSLTDLFNSQSDNNLHSNRNFVLLGKERHDIGRPYDWGYPIRGIVKDDMLYIHNFEADRWPAGNPETGYLNTDGSPTKTYILNHRTDQQQYHFWEWNFGKRSKVELYDIKNDLFCLRNLAEDPEYHEIKEELKSKLFRELKNQDDPRMYGQGYLFDSYKYMHEENRNFYFRYMEGEEMETGWVNDTDFEKKPLPEQR
jgi:arylsulfatase A-like enzyme